MPDAPPATTLRAPTLDAVAAMRDVTLHVRVTHANALRVRLWLALRLILLAARVLNCQVDVEVTRAAQHDFD